MQLETHTSPQLKQTVTTDLIQQLEMLQLSSIDLFAHIQEKVLENPLLEMNENHREKYMLRGRMIDKTIEKVLEKLKNLPDKEYFELVEKLVSRYLQPSDGIIALGAKDMARLPDGFEKRLSELAGKKGGTIKISAEPCDIDDGFILSYGLISENCSFSAVLEAEKDDIRDTAARVLFRQVEQ